MSTHVRNYFLTGLFCLLASLTQAQISSRPRVPTSQPPLVHKIWSDWAKSSGNPALEARFAKLTENVITLELRNVGTGTLEGEFTANECPDNQKDVSGWQKRSIEPGATISLTFSPGGCAAGIHWWYRNLYAWSAWFTLHPDSDISARWIKRSPTSLTIEVVNRKTHFVSASFAANFCDENQKSANGWKQVNLPVNQIVTLTFVDASAGRCNAGFHLWYKNLRGPGQIDDGTELVPAGN